MATQSEDFDAFYTATAKRLVATVYAMTGDVAEAEDAVQEAYIRAWQRWDRLTREGEDPLPWVRTVAMRLAIGTWRRTRAAPRALPARPAGRCARTVGGPGGPAGRPA